MTDTIAQSQQEITQNEINIAQSHMQSGYYLWYWIHIILGIATITFPATAAIIPFETQTVKLLSGFGALCGAIYAFVRPHDFASGYDRACQDVWRVDVAFNLKTIMEADVAKGLEKAIRWTTFRYNGPDV